MKFSQLIQSLFLVFSLGLNAQSVIDQIDQQNTTFNGDTSRLVTEQIDKVSTNGSIFVLTNNNQSFFRGDFISIVFSNQLVVRGLVARLKQNKAGIKITKLYNQQTWKNLGAGNQVQVIRGDDSFFTSSPTGVAKTEDEIEAESLIKEEEDLYNNTTLDEDEELLTKDEAERKGRVIKTDNIVNVGYGFIDGLTTSGKSTRYGQLNASYAYQIDDNIWVEGLFGQGTVNDFPNTGLDTKLTNLTLRVKYTFAGPFYSYLLPYVGYQSISVSSPGAGVSDGSTAQSVLDEENRLVSESEKSSLIGGVTVLKRMVPGWFARVELGTDIINLGLSLEF